MNSITTRQNDQHFIELLKAQRVAYSQCKIYQVFDVVSIIIAILFPLLALEFPSSQDKINAFGVLWTIAYLVTEGYRKNKTTQGATIQEQFDTELFQMQWNKILCKDKINIDNIHELAKKYNKRDLKNWYSNKIDQSLPEKIAIILCQRINFSWEITQRKNFVVFLMSIVSVYYFIYIAIGFRNNIGFFSLLVILSPSISFLIYGVLNVLSLRTHIKSKNDSLKIIDAELENYKTRRTLPTDKTLRQIQDVIYNERCLPEKVPDWFFRLNRNKNENFIDNLILKIQNKL